MARRPSTAEVLLGLREARLARKGTRKRGTMDLSRQQRLALAPKAPRAQATKYLQALDAVLGRARELTEELIIPVLPQLVKASPGVVSQPDAPDAQLGARVDCAGIVIPSWYVRLHQGPVARRLDAPGGVYAERLGQLEVALSELVRDPKLVQTLAQIASGVDAHNRAEMSRVLQINLRDDQSLRVFIDQFIRENTRLIQSVASDQLQRMEGVIARSTSGQVRVEDLRDEIMATFDVSRSRAALIARDQTLKANADLTQLRQQRVGVTDYIWTTTKDERVRGRPGGKWADSQSDHWALDGTRQSWISAPVTNPVTGERNHPGRDYQCRCIPFPVVDDLLAGL